jgi:hypothetical protein
MEVEELCDDLGRLGGTEYITQGKQIKGGYSLMKNETFKAN